ncbi:MAG TPA: hypothetical protein VF815_22760 [Myxococcaceae bacterium]|jgi:hypothetical protein
MNLFTRGTLRAGLVASGLLISAVSSQASAAMTYQPLRPASPLHHNPYHPGLANIGPDGFPVIPGGHYIARHCGSNIRCQSEPDFRNYYVGYRSVLSTPKPAGARQQVMSFDMWSPDYFTMAQQEHLAIGLHGQFPLDFSDLEGSQAHHGLGILIGKSDCGQGATSVRVEAFWPTGSTVTGRCTPHVLRNNVPYGFRITVSDAGEIRYTVTDKRTGTLVLSDSLDGAQLFNHSRYPFPTHGTGYFIVPAANGNADYTMYLTDLRVSWER